MKIEITAPLHRQSDAGAISIEEYQKRRVQRRRRVAKRKLKAVPLFAVEEMQAEFPGYTYDEFVADVTRKTRKGKSFRKPKTKAFDWRHIRQEIPDFFTACTDRQKTKATLRGKLKDGTQFTCIVRATWHGEYGEGRLRTGELIKLWRGPLKTFLQHPAMMLLEHNNEIQDQP